MFAQFKILTFSLLLALWCGCSPKPDSVDAADSSKEVVSEEAVPEEAPPSPALTAPVLDPDAAKGEYVVLCEPWDRYFRSQPYILIVDNLSVGIADLLLSEQKLIKTVLDANRPQQESSDYAMLTEQLAELKTFIPAAETATGYVESTRRRYGYSYTSGGVIYTRTSPYYYTGTYYRVIREKTKSSSPQLVRSVEGLIHNATVDLKDLDQRVEALQHLISSWGRRTSTMSVNGTEGIMRDANEAYLASLRDFTKDFIQFRAQVREVEEEQARIAKNRTSILSEWANFEQDRLPVLHSFLQDNSGIRVSLDKESKFQMPSAALQKKVILVCEIGERKLFFDVSDRRSSLHPFVLIDITGNGTSI